MTGSVAAKRIKDHLPRIRELGVVRLALFGSAARDEMTEASDLDVMVVFAEGRKTFDNFMELKLLLEDLFPGMTVDLVLESSLKSSIRDRVLSEARDVA
jgi:predicted nucleotidyltransferase